MTPGGHGEPVHVLVSDAHTRPSLAVTRALGARGVRVSALVSRPPALAGASRFAWRAPRVPDVESHPAAWAEAVERLLRADPRALLLPVTEPAAATRAASRRTSSGTCPR
jgi:hypothetical protein